MNLVRWIAILAMSMIFTGCSVIDYFVITDTEITEPPMAGEETPPDLHYVIGDSLSPMNRGSYCWTSDTVGMCVDMIPPSYEENQHILFPSHTIELLFFPPVPDTISVSLHPGSNMMTRIADIALIDIKIDDDGRIFANIPEEIEGHFILSVFATWEDYGDASYHVPILL